MTAREIVANAREVRRKIEAGGVEGVRLDAYDLAGAVIDLLDTPDEVPTVEQGIALARFLRPHFREPRPGGRYAQVSRGGAGLSDDYLLVRLSDGYEGGIDRDGRVST